jgi:NADH:ubiquinone oxidoreductase subunit H
MITHSDDLALMLSEISTIKSFSIKTSQKITPSFTILAFLIKTLFILYYKLLTNFLISYPKKQLQQLLNYSFLILLVLSVKLLALRQY